MTDKSFAVSVIIVNWNTRDILRDCLRSVYEQTRGISFEVIVIDNASSDGSVAMVKAEFPQVVLIENRDNRGFAAANNQGMAIARGRYCLLLNSDTVVLDGAIQKTIAFADQHPKAAVVGCRVLNRDLTLQPTCFMFPSVLNMFLSMSYLYKAFPRSRFFGREFMTGWNRNDIRSVETVTGCFMLVRREAIEPVGVMDEGFFMYAEETDWCRRFQQAGWVNLFYPDAHIIHLGGQSTQQIKPQMTLQLRAGILQYIRKHDGGIRYFLACILTSLWFAFRIPFWWIYPCFRGPATPNRFQVAKTYGLGAFRSLWGYSALRYRKGG
jgi:GT2 family glycosyltransferase